MDADELAAYEAETDRLEACNWWLARIAHQMAELAAHAKQINERTASAR